MEKRRRRTLPRRDSGSLGLALGTGALLLAALCCLAGPPTAVASIPLGPSIDSQVDHGTPDPGEPTQAPGSLQELPADGDQSATALLPSIVFARLGPPNPEGPRSGHHRLPEKPPQPTA